MTKKQVNGVFKNHSKKQKHFWGESWISSSHQCGVNCKWTGTLSCFLTGRKKRKSVPWLQSWTIHPWESMYKKLGYILKTCHSVLREKTRYEQWSCRGRDWCPPNNSHWSCINFPPESSNCEHVQPHIPHLFTSICSETFQLFHLHTEHTTHHSVSWYLFKQP